MLSSHFILTGWFNVSRQLQSNILEFTSVIVSYIVLFDVIMMDMRDSGLQFRWNSSSAYSINRCSLSIELHRQNYRLHQRRNAKAFCNAILLTRKTPTWMRSTNVCGCVLFTTLQSLCRAMTFSFLFIRNLVKSSFFFHNNFQAIWPEFIVEI